MYIQAVILWMHSGAGTIKHLLSTTVHSVGIQMRRFQLTEVKTVRFSGVLFPRVLLFPDTQRDVTDTAVFSAAIMCYSAITLWLTIHQEIRELAAAAWVAGCRRIVLPYHLQIPATQAHSSRQLRARQTCRARRVRQVRRTHRTHPARRIRMRGPLIRATSAVCRWR